MASTDIQKTILSVIVSEIKHCIVGEIGNVSLSLFVDEARYESRKQQMSLIC